MDEFERQEYKVLRATIRERGTVRAITFCATVIAWAALALVVLASGVHPLAPLLPLLVLVAGFEVIFQLHLGVERVGRYLQVAYEERREGATAAGGDVAAKPWGWETAAMAYGAAFPARGSDALFGRLFLLAAFVNGLSIPAAFGGLRRPLAGLVLVLAHLAFALRIVLAKRRAGRQRDEDLARFRELLARR